ncbi:GNAT family N-acetyltransferase [uncultured Roseobacter sp.]|uniref:GNAT family N-acetyltransferase n=1 Tax=uncultured Roseobacter sp. TaxID=114847 RepID=UPI0026028F9C|nr:GNAT family N-acetyltransferase [uncultured Roseobacter sp.]
MPELTALSERLLGQAHALSQAEGWPHLPNDWGNMIANGRGLGLMSEGALIGTVLWWEQTTHATLGMVIVAAAHRQRGHGARLVTEALKQIGERNILLHATGAGLPGYARLGFVPVGIIHQHQGHAARPPLPDTDLDISRMSARDVTRIADVDKAARGWDRTDLLQALMQKGTCWAAARDGRIVGYALERHAGKGSIIGPIVADAPETAQALVTRALHTAKNAFFRIDSDPGLGLCDWLEAIGLSKVDMGTTMLKGEQPLIEPSVPVKLYGLASQAYG